jgi:hypothetical protein
MGLMLWKEPYAPIVLYELPELAFSGPSLAGGVGTSSTAKIVLGAGSPSGFLALGTLRRLLRSSGFEADQEWALFERNDESLASLRAMVLSDQYDRVLFAEPVPEQLLSAGPVQPHWCFAALQDGSRTRVLVVGPPTEDVWESFEELLTAARES